MQMRSINLGKLKGVVIREGERSDLQRIWDLFNLVVQERLYLPTLNPVHSYEHEASWFYEIQNPGNLLLVADYEKQLAGYLTLERCNDEASAHVCSLGILVHPEFRRQGLGMELIRNAVAEAAKLGYKKIILSAFQSNQTAIGLYEKLGFSIIGVRKRQFKIDDNYTDEILMERFLNDV